ncbi:hypothetical protein SRHO_G00014280 [Serrasalmus rhombeus]
MSCSTRSSSSVPSHYYSLSASNHKTERERKRCGGEDSAPGAGGGMLNRSEAFCRRLRKVAEGSCICVISSWSSSQRSRLRNCSHQCVN